MNIVYYTEEEKIISCHKCENNSYEELVELATDFNNSPNSKRKAVIKCVEDDSLTAFLVRKLEEKHSVDKDIIDSIRQNLNSIDDLISDLSS